MDDKDNLEFFSLFSPFKKGDVLIIKAISHKGKSITGTWGEEWIVKSFRRKVGFSLEKDWMFIETIKRLSKTDWWKGIWVNLKLDENFKIIQPDTGSLNWEYVNCW